MDTGDFILDKTRLIRYEGNDEILRLPDFITDIGENAFANNQTLKKVIFPNPLRKIEKMAFYQCRYLKAVTTLPPTIAWIGTEAFADCLSLEEVTWSDKTGKVTIEDRAFHDCISLKNFSFPVEIERISPGVLRNCISLESVNFQDAIYFNFNSIENCKKLKQIYCKKDSVIDTYFLIDIRQKMFHNNSENIKLYEMVYTGDTKHSKKVQKLIAMARQIYMCEFGYSLPENYLDDFPEEHIKKRLICRIWTEKKSNTFEELLNDKIKDYTQENMSLGEIVAENLIYKRIQLNMTMEDLSNAANIPPGYILQYEEFEAQDIFKNIDYVKSLFFCLNLTKKQAFIPGYVFFKNFKSKIKDKDIVLFRLHFDNEYYNEL